MKEYIRGDGNNSLWLMEENDNDIIYPAKAIITNQTLYNELLDELKNMSSYVLQENKHITDSVMSITNDEHIIYYVDGHAVKYGETYDHNYYERGTKCVERRRSMSRYVSPTSELFRVLTTKFLEDEQLLLLFNSYNIHLNKEERLNEIKKVKEFFEKLKSSGLDDETIKIILNKMWPSFGLFATEGLDCIDFVIDRETKYSLSKLRDIIKYSVGANVKHHSDIDVLLKHENAARENTMTLSLAKHINSSLK